MAGYRIYLAEAAPRTPVIDKLYNALIAMDAQFCLGKVNGSIELHYNQGQLMKIHKKEVI